MPGILHLYPAQCDFQTQRSIESLKTTLGGEIPMDAMAIGPGGRFSNPPRAILALRARKMPQTHIAQAWGPAELIVAAMSGFSRIVFSPQSEIPDKWAGFVGAILRRRPVEIVLPSAALRKFFVDRNAPECRVISPGVDFARVRPANPRLRAELGLADSDLVLLAAGESTREAMHRRCVWSTAILSVVNERYRLLTWGRGPSVGALARFAKAQQREHILVQTEKVLTRSVEFEDLAAISDFAIMSARPVASILCEHICMAAGLPIVAAAGDASNGFLQDRVTALVEAYPTPRRLAQCILDLQKDAVLRSAISKAAQSTAREHLSIERFAGEWRRVYSDFSGLSSSFPIERSDCSQPAIAVT